MRRHTWSGATAMVVLSLAVACSGEAVDPSTSPIIPTTPVTPGSTPVALARDADTLQVDESIQLTAIIPPAPGGSTAPVWSSSNNEVVVVSQTGVLFAVKSGVAVVSVSSRGATDATTVTVQPSVRDVTLDADTLAIAVTESVELPFRVVDTDGNAVNLNNHTVEWTSTAPDVASLTGDATVTGRTLGWSDVRLRVDGKYGTTKVRVLPKAIAQVVVAPSSAALKVGDRLQLATTFFDVSGEPVAGRPVTWSSSNPSVLNVTSDGLLVALAAGQADVTAKVDGKRAVVPVDVAPYAAPAVAPAPVADVTVTLNAASIRVGQSTQANAVLKDASSNPLTGRTVTWTVSDAAIASVNATGSVTALKSGTVTVTATSEGKTGSASLTTLESETPVPTVASVTVSLAASPIVVGSTTQAKVVLKDSVGTVITGRPVNWVSSDAAVATVDNAGLVASVKVGSVSITASADGKTGSVVFTGNPPAPVITNVVLSANATSIEMGELTQVSAVVKDNNGATVTGIPVTFSSSPTTTATITSAGLVTGRGVGTATITARADTVIRTMTISVADSATTTAPTAPTAPVPTGPTGPTYGSATAAELPRVSVATAYPTMTRQVRVPAGSSLQLAINNAQPGDELLLAPGATYVGNFTLPVKSGSGWIVIRTDLSDAVIGAPGTRMTPSRAAAARLAKILTPDNMSTITSALGSHHYRFTGVEIGASAASTDINALVRFGEGSSVQNSVASIAHNLIIDRSWVHGAPTLPVRRCVALNSGTSAVIDSWLGDCHSNVSDSQAIVGWNGPGPYLIQNNHLEGGHEVIMFGGSGVSITNQSPSDITIRGNHIMRPLSWKGVWQAKNLLETKHARRLLVEGNVLENNWADAQAGFAVIFKSVNQDNNAPWSQSTDITFRYNKIRNTGNGINLAGKPESWPAVPAARIVITDNVMENVNASPYAGDGHSFQLLGGLSDIVVKHNTVVSANGGSSFSMLLDGTVTNSRLVVHSNVLHHGMYGVKGSGQSEGTNTIAKYAPGGLLTNNVIASGPSGLAPYYPANNYFPTMSGVGFVSLAGGDYRLSSSSGYAGKAYDGGDVGADVPGVNAATANAVVAP